jgi:hypothetical protein
MAEPFQVPDDLQIRVQQELTGNVLAEIILMTIDSVAARCEPLTGDLRDYSAADAVELTGAAVRAALRSLGWIEPIRTVVEADE